MARERDEAVRAQVEILNDRIDRMRAERGLRGLRAWDCSERSTEVAMLQMAAHLNSLRPRAGTPDPAFVASLRARMSSAAAGHGP